MANQVNIIGSRYQVLGQIGAGGMGSVYRVFDPLSQTELALKQLHVPVRDLTFNSKSNLAKHSGTEQYLIALANEFRTLASLRHRHIIGVRDYGIDDGQPFFTMDLLPHSTSIIDVGQNTADETRIEFVFQLLLALEYLHRHGIIHRDLKPDNIMVVDQQVKVLDFGLAVLSEKEQGRAGTIAYMAPETLRSRQAVFQSDFYAVGVILYQLFAQNRLPFEPSNVMGILQHTPDLEPVDAPPGVKLVIERLLQKSPAARYPTAYAIIEALCEALNYPLPHETREIRESFLQAAQFVGREQEQQSLKDALIQAQQGRGSTWLIGGESGVGKSRLLDEFRATAMVEGVLVLRGQAVEDGRLPYQVWRNVLPHLLLASPVDKRQAGVLKEIVPAIDRLVGYPVAPAPRLTGRAHHIQLALTLMALLKAQPQPVLIVLEDLQWVAADSLALLRHVVENVGELSLLMVGTYRNDETPTLPDELPKAHLLTLPRFQPDEIAQLSTAMLGDSGRQPTVVDLLVQETEGNIFFLVEVVRALAEEAGALAQVGHSTLPEHVFTGGMQRIIQRRLAKVPEKFSALLRLAAVIGREIDRKLLTHSYSVEQVDEWLISGVQAAVLAVQDNQWRFAHDKLRETVLAGLPSNNQRQLHHDAAVAIEQVYPENPDYYAALLEHWHHAKNLERELFYLEPVADHLINIGAEYDKAKRLLGRGLQALADDNPRCISLWNLQASVCQYRNDFVQMRTFAEKALALAQHTGDRSGIAKSFKHLGSLTYYQGDYAQAQAYYQKSYEQYQIIGEQEGNGGILYNLGMVEHRRGNHDQAQDYYQQALVLSQAFGNQQSIVRVLDALGLLAGLRGNYAQANNYHQQSLTLKQAIGDQYGIANSFNNLGNIAMYQTNYEQAHEYHQQSLTIKQAIGDQRGIAVSFNNLGLSAQAQGDYAQAHDYHQQSLLIKRTLGEPRIIALSLNNLGAVAYAQGDYQQAQEYYQQSLRLKQSVGNPYDLSFTLTHLVFLYLRLNDQKQSADTLQEALLAARTSASIPLMLEGVLGLAWLRLQQGDPLRAGELFGLVQHHPGSNSDVQLRLQEFQPVLAEALPLEQLAAAAQRGAALDLDTVVAALLAAD